MPNDLLPVAVQLRLEAACARFEAAWRATASAATAPRIEDHLGNAAGPERAALLRELLRLDVHYRRRRGEHPGANYYAACCPADAQAVRALFAELFRVAQPPQLASPPKGSGDTIHSGPAAGPATDPNRTGPAEPPALPHAAPAQYPTIPNYEVLGELGRGGMGVVYKARQTGLNRLAALKVILSGDYAGPEERDRFHREAEAIARLQHPHIVQVYEVGEHGGLPFFSLELCSGGSLADQLDGTPWPAARAAELVRTLAGAMQAAHRANVVHRDLKPANVLLTADGQLKVTDFGLAKKLDEVGHTPTGAIVGTPSYMAPEQAGGKPKEIGPLADVYALGVILYELLTGRPPFKAATSLDTVLQVLSEEPVAPRSLNPAVPRDLETICLKCLEKDPHRRYGSAAALAEELQCWLAGRPISARPVGNAERLWRWGRRNPLVAFLAATAAFLLVLFVIVLVVSYLQTSAALGVAQEAQRQEEVQRQEAERQKEDALRKGEQVRRERDRINGLLYLAQMPQALHAYEAGDLVQLRELLEEHRPRPGWADHRGWEWYHLHAMCGGNLWATRSHADLVLALAWTADGKRLASADGAGMIKVLDTSTGRELVGLRAHAGPVHAVSWGPDGKRLASAGADSPHHLSSWPERSTVKVWDVDSGKEGVSLPVAASGYLGTPAPAWSPDGQRLAVRVPVVPAPDGRSWQGDVCIWDLAKGKEVLTLRAELRGPRHWPGAQTEHG
jgi:hypothetical protein